MVQLQTERTIIRDHCEEDLLTHHALFSDKTGMYYLQDIATNTLEESKINLQTTINEIDKMNRKLYFLRIEDKDSREHIGEIGYTVEKTTPLGKLVGMGYFIRQKFWGRGYTTEALKELIRFAFEEDGVFRISCGCIKDNIGSEKVMIKGGMIKEAEFKSYVWHDGKLKDRVEYRILKNEWKPE
ncbi:GNAT family protein [Anaerocolumna sp. AGMB13025]|uniref:GNAT family N-acetyltransferase n=1 Tax=Anaerocolumna sp. AGMB13025 TaxID=3039116 RepID=UPI00241CEA7F|nr:GNAT family protein [Anaerocolumna sp. AGMB13025]WFR57230.1 GNAT family protein [Anaerocolumna sp. AGMB13025]